MRLPKDLEVPVFCKNCARPLVPLTPVRPRALEHVEVPVPGRFSNGRFLIGAPVGPRLLEDLEVPVRGSTRAL